MPRIFASLALGATLLAASGCVSVTPPGQVPWWIGLPCLVIAPSSLEAEVWRDRLHAADAGETITPPAVSVQPGVPETVCPQTLEAPSAPLEDLQFPPPPVGPWEDHGQRFE